MSKDPSKIRFENLVKTGSLKSEPADKDELEGLVRSAKPRLKDASIDSLSLESRFDLSYNAAHSLCLAALRAHGYRSENRYIVFQLSTETLGLDKTEQRILDDAHRRRNNAEYSGIVDIDEALVKSLLEVTKTVLKKVSQLHKSS